MYVNVHDELSVDLTGYNISFGLSRLRLVAFQELGSEDALQKVSNIH